MLTLYQLQAVFEVEKGKSLVLTELFDGVGVEDVRAATGCSFQVLGMLSGWHFALIGGYLLQVSDNLKPMGQI